MATPLIEVDDWGMRWARPPHPQAHPVGTVFVHHTAGVDPSDVTPTWDDDPARAFRNLNEVAIGSKGYSAIDYSMLTHRAPNGQVTNGVARGEWTPAATKDSNTTSKAVCLLGWFHPPDPRNPWTALASRHPAVEELAGLADAIVEMIERGWVTRTPKILGHRDNPKHPGATACCGDYLYAELPTIRRLVAERLNPPPPTPDPVPAPEEDDDMNRAIAAVYQPSKAVTRPNAKTFGLLPDGSVRHLSGPDTAYAKAAGADTFPIEGDEHYDQLHHLSQVNEPG
jgi:hypothetical protein